MKFNVSDDLKHACGIYKIENTVDGKVYVGKTVDFYRRYHQHVYTYRKAVKRGANRYLYNAFKKHGIDNFVFSILEICRREDASELELLWMEKLSSLDRAFGYNLRADSSSGMITHEDTRKLLTELRKKEWREGIRDGHAAKMTRWLFEVYDPDRDFVGIYTAKELDESSFYAAKSRISVKDAFLVKMGSGGWVRKVLVDNYKSVEGSYEE